MNKLAIISNIQVSGEQGGAEIFYTKLHESLRTYVTKVDLICVPCSEATFEDILKGYLKCYDLNLKEYDGVISAKAPTYAIRHPNHVCYLMHTIRVFYDMYDEISMDASNIAKRDLIYRLDKEFLSYPHCKKLFSIGNEVTKRQLFYTGIKSEPLHPGITHEGFHFGKYEYIYMPGRLHKWKRVNLVVEAMKFVHVPIKLKIAGIGPEMESLKILAGDNSNIEFLGYVTDEQMKDLYANALAVTFTPLREDYGYILHEAFKSQKPVITCSDSGEPAYFVEDGVNGFVTPPDPRAIAKCIDLLYNNKSLAYAMGCNGFKSIEHITWDHVARKLLEALEG